MLSRLTLILATSTYIFLFPLSFPIWTAKKFSKTSLLHVSDSWTIKYVDVYCSYYFYLHNIFLLSFLLFVLVLNIIHQLWEGSLKVYLACCSNYDANEIFLNGVTNNVTEVSKWEPFIGSLFNITIIILNINPCKNSCKKVLPKMQSKPRLIPLCELYYNYIYYFIIFTILLNFFSRYEILGFIYSINIKWFCDSSLLWYFIKSSLSVKLILFYIKA